MANPKHLREQLSATNQSPFVLFAGQAHGGEWGKYYADISKTPRKTFAPDSCVSRLPLASRFLSQSSHPLNEADKRFSMPILLTDDNDSQWRRAGYTEAEALYRAQSQSPKVLRIAGTVDPLRRSTLSECYTRRGTSGAANFRSSLPPRAPAGRSSAEQYRSSRTRAIHRSHEQMNPSGHTIDVTELRQKTK